jgi:hypothetical protein
MKVTSLLLLALSISASALHAQSVQQLQAQIKALQTLCEQTAKNEQALQAQVTALQKSPVQALANYVSVDYSVENGVKAPNVTFHGVNVHIVNGSGNTMNINGLGNLIIGYDEVVGQPSLQPGDRGGSHNLVMGTGNKFNASSWSGIVNGDNNLIGAQESVILTGANNSVNTNVSPGYSAYGVIVTGFDQTVFDAQASVIVGGSSNNIGYINDVILGGINNNNGGVYSVVLGGANNSVQHFTGTDQDIIIPAFSVSSGIKLPLQ